MGFLDSILGRSRPKQADLDALFMVPSAAITLEASLGLRPTGQGAVCYRAAGGAAFAQTENEILSLLRDAPDAPGVTTSHDEFGYTWLVVDDDPDDVGRAVHRPARREHHLGGPGLRAGAAVLAGAVRGPRRPSRRAGLPLQAGHLLPLRAPARRCAASATPSSRSTCARRSPASCRSSRRPRAGSRSGVRRACDPAGSLFGCTSRSGLPTLTTPRRARSRARRAPRGEPVTSQRTDPVVGFPDDRTVDPSRDRARVVEIDRYQVLLDPPRSDLVALVDIAAQVAGGPAGHDQPDHRRRAAPDRHEGLRRLGLCPGRLDVQRRAPRRRARSWCRTPRRTPGSPTTRS